MQYSQKTLKHMFECTLWQARWAVILAVFCSGLASIVIFYITALDAFFVAKILANYAFITDIAIREPLRAEALGHVVQVVDGFLLAIVLMIFTFGVYELYISKIDIAYSDESAEHMLSINSLDDLKSRLGKVILMVMIVKFFELAIDMKYNDVYDLIYFAIGILIISVSLFLTESMLKPKGKGAAYVTSDKRSGV